MWKLSLVPDGTDSAHAECRHLLHRKSTAMPLIAASQKLSNALNNIILAPTVDSLEISKVLHCSRYSSENNADRATKIIKHMQHARSYRTQSKSSL
jgi:hypothetical protein